MGENINYKIMIKIMFISFLLLFFINGSLALNSGFSNESIQAKEALSQAEKSISEMIGKNIPINRVNETYQEAFQFYLAQSAFEKNGNNAKYDLIIKYTSEINLIKKTAIEANDELRIFKETFEDLEKNTNFSEMKSEYDDIFISFEEERFEDTLTLINQGYDRISEIQSSQTTINVIYLVTSRTIKNFFINYGLTIIISILISISLFLIFKNNLKKLMRRKKFNHLMIQKRAINLLIKDIQKEYFKTKKLSETEYNTKLKKFKEIIRDADRQIMVLKEDIFKLKKRRKN